MIEWLDNIDEDIFLFLHHLTRSVLLDKFMWFVSDTWVWIPFYVAIAWLLIYRFGWKRGCLIIVAIALATVCTDRCCAALLRPLVERLRPANLENPISGLVYLVNDYRGGAYGFPSCHAANTFMLATFIALICRNGLLTTTMFVWALVNCLSRIYLGVHYPGDILFGAMVGAMFAFVWYLIAVRVLKITPVAKPTSFPKAYAIPVTAFLLTLLSLWVISLAS